jgi:hypothetical protein
VGLFWLTDLSSAAPIALPAALSLLLPCLAVDPVFPLPDLLEVRGMLLDHP